MLRCKLRVVRNSAYGYETQDDVQFVVYRSSVDLHEKIEFDSLQVDLRGTMFPNNAINRTEEGRKGLLAAQDSFPTHKMRDKFAADYSYLSKHWEAISPRPYSKSI